MENDYVINLHLHEGCNFQCKPCFAKFETHCTLSADKWRRAIDNILTTKPVRRFNLAGDEPLLYPDLDYIIDYIHNHNIDVSVITNGFLLTEKL
jgi:radical S-adenosyl methionine domain-containing protein 2